MSLADLFDRLAREQAVAAASVPTVTIAEALEQIHAAKFTGASLVHWHEGRIRTIEPLRPARIVVTG